MPCVADRGAGEVSDEILMQLYDIVQAAERRGYLRGIAEGASRLEVLASVIETSVTKRWLIEQAGRDAAILREKLVERS